MIKRVQVSISVKPMIDPYNYPKSKYELGAWIIVSEKLRPLCTFRIFFSKTASRAVINMKFEQKSASRAEVKHKTVLKLYFFEKS